MKNGQKINASITISRDSSDIVRIRVKDRDSVNEFLTISMTPHDFAMAITGLSEIPAEAVTRGLTNVGMRRVTEARTAIAPFSIASTERN